MAMARKPNGHGLIGLPQATAHRRRRRLRLRLLPASACLIALLLLLMLQPCRGAQPPSPGYYPSRMFRSLAFSEGYSTLWGPQHQSLSPDQKALIVWMDRSSGSGFKSRQAYRSGYFGASIKVQAGYTAGVNTAFYLSNGEQYPGQHDEVDMELLGTVPGEPYTLQTNVYVRGSGDGGTIVGREMSFHLWFDPVADFHHYAILWNPDQILFLVDDVPIRQYERKAEGTFPEREMWAYGSVWDASDWATDGGRHRADYRFQPFVSRYTDLKLAGCTAGTGAAAGCLPVPASPSGGGGGGAVALSPQQEAAMRWAQRSSMVYYYCQDSSRDHTLYPEC